MVKYISGFLATLFFLFFFLFPKESLGYADGNYVYRTATGKEYSLTVTIHWDNKNGADATIRKGNVNRIYIDIHDLSREGDLFSSPNNPPLIFRAFNSRNNPWSCVAEGVRRDALEINGIAQPIGTFRKWLAGGVSQPVNYNRFLDSFGLTVNSPQNIEYVRDDPKNRNFLHIEWPVDTQQNEGNCTNQTGDWNFQLLAANSTDDGREIFKKLYNNATDYRVNIENLFWISESFGGQPTHIQEQELTAYLNEPATFTVVNAQPNKKYTFWIDNHQGRLTDPAENKQSIPDNLNVVLSAEAINYIGVGTHRMCLVENDHRSIAWLDCNKNSGVSRMTLKILDKRDPNAAPSCSILPKSVVKGSTDRSKPANDQTIGETISLKAENLAPGNYRIDIVDTSNSGETEHVSPYATTPLVVGTNRQADFNLGKRYVGNYTAFVYPVPNNPSQPPICSAFFEVKDETTTPGGGGDRGTERADADKCENGKTAVSNKPCTASALQRCNVDTGTKVEGTSTLGEKEGVLTAIGCVPTEPKALIQGLVKIAVGAGGGIALLLMVWGAFQMITSAGNPETLKKGKDTFTSAIVGLLFAIFSILILQIIGVQILAIPGFT
jgi:hypothetical protein